MADPSDAWRALGCAPDGDRVFRLVADAPAGPDWVDASSPTPNLDGGPSGLLRCFILDKPHPHTIDDAVAFVADAAAIVVVEGLARGYARALAPWSLTGTAARKIAWRFLRADVGIPRSAGGMRVDVIAECLEAALDEAGVPVTYERGRLASPLGALWRDAVSRGLLVPRELLDPYFLNGALGPSRVPEAVQGRRFADLSDPFEPLEAIAALGYRIEAVGDEAITLLAAAPRA